MREIADLDNLTESERHFLIAMRQRLNARDPWTRGTFAESLVATQLPGARLAAHSAAPWDIEWPDGDAVITIAVRATGSYSMDHVPGGGRPPFAGSWRFPRSKRAWDPVALTFVQDDLGDAQRRCWADIAVLCRHDSYDISDGWTCYVLSQAALEAWPAEVLRPSPLSASGIQPIELATLPDAIRRARAGGHTTVD